MFEVLEVIVFFDLVVFVELVVVFFVVELTVVESVLALVVAPVE